MTQITQAARAALIQAQGLAVFGLCMGAAMVLPLALALNGIAVA